MVPIEISYSLIKRRRLSGKGLQNGDENDCKKDFQFNTTRQMLQTILSLACASKNFFKIYHTLHLPIIFSVRIFIILTGNRKNRIDLGK